MRNLCISIFATCHITSGVELYIQRGWIDDKHLQNNCMRTNFTGWSEISMSRIIAILAYIQEYRWVFQKLECHTTTSSFFNRMWSSGCSLAAYIDTLDNTSYRLFNPMVTMTIVFLELSVSFPTCIPCRSTVLKITHISNLQIFIASFFSA